MKKDQMIIGAAVLFAAALVAQKTGLLKKFTGQGGSSVPFSMQGFGRLETPFAAGDTEGYNPADPGRYVTTDDLIIGVTDNDWQNIPTFQQTADAVLATPGQMVGRLVVPWGVPQIKMGGGG